MVWPYHRRGDGARGAPAGAVHFEPPDAHRSQRQRARHLGDALLFILVSRVGEGVGGAGGLTF